MKVSRNAVIWIAWLSIVACTRSNQESYSLDVRRLANKRPQEVEKLLGNPDSSYTFHMMGKPVFCQVYRDRYLVVQYPGMLSTDFVISGPHGLPFDHSALQAFDVDYRQHHLSDYRQNSYLRWSDIEGFSAISFYNARLDSQGKVIGFDIFLKAATDR